ncbi:Carbonic anhydrase 1 [Halotydeus destructor]|nr:Carbonic anhydrase 1 [Halotydeus destructor]
MDIRPNLLLHDHELGPFHVDRKAVSGLLENNGHSIIFTVHDDSTSGSGARDGGEGSTMSSSEKGSEHGVEPLVNIRGGPLSYEYTFQAVHLHFGRTDEHGSEHTIDGLAFPAEVWPQFELEHVSRTGL